MHAHAPAAARRRHPHPPHAGRPRRAGLETRRPSAPLPEAAGPWIERVIAARGLPLQVEVVPADSPDAYWPNADTIALGEATYGGRRPKDWAVAAHELGHALNVAVHPAMTAVLPGARLGSTLGWRLCIAGLIAASLFDEPVAVWIAGLALLASVACTAAVCADEVGASRHAARIIGADDRVARPGLRRAVSAMRAAASAYLLGAVGQLLVLGAFPLLAWAVIDVPRAPKSPSDLGFTLVLAVTPIVLLRAALALVQAVRPEPVPSELDLWDLLGREARWESLCAVGVVGVVAAMHPAVGGPAAAVATALAVSVALGPVQGLGAALVSLPLVVWRRFQARPARVDYLKPARDDVPAAMIAMWADPPWYLRVSWLMPLAYLPLVLLLAVRVFLLE
ncbi:MAG: zinc metallopeptidase [Myxococcota bacterium]